jgi:hypothetical protein
MDGILFLMLWIVIIGFVAWVLGAVLPLPPPFPQIIYGVAAIACLFMVVSYFTGHHVLVGP